MLKKYYCHRNLKTSEKMPAGLLRVFYVIPASELFVYFSRVLGALCKHYSQVETADRFVHLKSWNFDPVQYMVQNQTHIYLCAIIHHTQHVVRILRQSAISCFYVSEIGCFMREFSPLKWLT